MSSIDLQLAALANHLRQRRGVLVEAWHTAVWADPQLHSGRSLPAEQLSDHIPAILAAYEQALAAPGAAAAEAQRTRLEAEVHGLHRWQHGYRLREVIAEFGKLNLCVIDELEAYAVANLAVLDPQVPALARRRWAQLCSLAIEQSVQQYFELQQLESAGHARELGRALAESRELERQRAELWRQAAHDLRGNLGVLVNATSALGGQPDPAPARAQLQQLLQRNVGSLLHLLEDVTSLARLQAGQEQRQLGPFDVAPLLDGICANLRPLAEQRRLALQAGGPAPFVVEGDAVKLRRIVQNLVLNAIRVTGEGRVSVGWGAAGGGDEQRWALTVADTGPGLDARAAATPLNQAVREATRLAQADAAAPDPLNQDVPPLPIAPDLPAGGDAARAPDGPPGVAASGPGEGIGLSIVKRLCELLDATIELDSAPGRGTRFRILLPRRYPPSDEAPVPAAEAGRPPGRRDTP